MKKIYFVRHGSTQGNLEKKYIGRTDEPLCDLGTKQAEALREQGIPQVDAVFVSPLLRCRQTAEILLPNVPKTVVSDLRECDFGAFEGKNYKELADDPRYAAWLDVNCTGQIPEGDVVEEFKARCVRGFQSCVDAGENLLFVVHGGTIMAIMEALCLPKKNFYEYHVGNCALVCCEFDGNVLKVEEKTC